MMNILFEFCEMPEEFEYNVALRYNEVDKKFYFYYRRLADAKASAELPKYIKALVLENPMVQMLVNGALASIGSDLSSNQPEGSRASQVDERGADKGPAQGAS